ncbi:MAG TPA: PAS domain S-box protein, partial [Opitutaceae bacterium]|nr:PAS domain S-box protein [Opitutaceae bacterium]
MPSSEIRPQPPEPWHSAEEGYRLLLASMRDCAFYMLDPEGRIVSWNTGAQAIEGYAEAEVLGQSFTMFYPPEDVAAGAPERTLARAAEKGRTEVEGWRVRKGGRRFWAHVVIAAIRDEHGRLLGYSKLTRDLTERQRSQQAIEQSFEELKQLQQELTLRNRELQIESRKANEANRMKSEFLANMSHELR